MASSPKKTNTQQYHRSVAQNKLANSLEARECVFRLCLNPQHTLNSLKSGLGSDVSASSADLSTIALCVLKKLFRSLKNDICHSKYNDPIPTEVLHLLRQTDAEPCSEIVDRYVSRWLERKSGFLFVSSTSSKWRQIEVLDCKQPYTAIEVPDNVPPLDSKLVEQCCYSPSPYSPQVPNPALQVLSYQQIPVGEASSSGESSLSSSSLSLYTDNSLSRQVAQEVVESVRVVQEVVNRVDRSCGPTPRTPVLSSRRQDSKQVQTIGTGKVDVGVNTIQNFLPAAESNSNNSSSYTTSNSSTMYSDLSAGQLPLHKAAILIARSQCNIVNVLADGSVPTPMLTSTPTTAYQPRVREVKETVFQHQSFPNLNIDSIQPPSRPTTLYRQTTPSVHEYLANDSAEKGSNSLLLMAREISLGTSFDSLSPKNRSMDLGKSNGLTGANKVVNSNTPRVNEDKQSNSSANARSREYSSENEDEESTLNQISPLPTTG